MPSLAELQSAFGALLADAEASPEPFFARHCVAAPAQRHAAALASYRRNTLGARAQATQASYSVLARIVGAHFLRAAALQYAAQTPSHSGDLNRYGASFADFLGSFAPAATLPYLPDVARLEWCVQALLAQTPAARDALQGLQQLPPDAWASLRFALEPAHALIASRWALADIWLGNQGDPEVPPPTQIDQPQQVLAWRGPAGVHVRALAPGEAEFFQALRAQQTLGAACDAAVQAHADFDLPQCLHQCLAQGPVVSFQT